MITERIMPIAMFLFFVMIGINGFIVVAGNLESANGTPINSIMGKGINQLSTDIDGTVSSVTYFPSGTDQTTTSTSAGFSIFKVDTWWGGLKKTGSDLIGVNNVNLINNVLFGIEQYMDVYIKLFPDFTAIFLSIKFFVLGIKGIMVGYVGTIIVRQLVGRGIF